MKHAGIVVVLSACMLVPAVAPEPAHAYPNGTEAYVTDAGPFCAGCHSSRQESQLQEMPKEQTSELRHCPYTASSHTGSNKGASQKS